MSDLERIVSAADRIESAAHRMAILFEDGYGGNGVRLLEVMETDVAELRAKLQAAEAEVKSLLESSEHVAIGSALQQVRITDLQAEVARLRAAMETDLIYVTSRMDEHPEGYEGACWCRSCCSYATDDGEGKP